MIERIVRGHLGIFTLVQFDPAPSAASSAPGEPQGVQVPMARQSDAFSFTVPRLDVDRMIALHHTR